MQTRTMATDDQTVKRLKAELQQAKLEAKVAKGLLVSELGLKRFVKRMLGFKHSAQADFRDGDYQQYIQRRLEHLESLRLPISGKTVLEVGAGIGELTSFFLDRGCRVTSTEVRQESLDVLRTRCTDVRQLDLDNPSTEISEQFDIVFCYGVLYHLSKPADAIRYMASRCRGILLLETRVSYGTESVLNQYLEVSDSPTQSAAGLGCRPTRQWVFDQLRQNFPYVYLPITQPHRPHFPIDWEVIPSGDVLSNAVFIGSREQLENELLVDSVLMKQRRT